MRKKILPLIFFAALCSNVFGGLPPVTIDPSEPEFADAHAVSSGKKFWIGVFGGGADTGEAVGHTRTGRKKLSPIVCDPPIAEAVRNTLLWALDEQGLLADSESEAEFVIMGKVTEFKMEETTKFLHQVINAALRVEVEVSRAGGGELVRTLRLQSGGERTTFDATKRAGAAAREAVKAAVGELLKGLDSL